MLAALAMETAAAERRRRYAELLREPQARSPLDASHVKEALRTMRADALDRQSSLVQRAIAVWSEDNDLQVTVAHNAEEAVHAIVATSPRTRQVAINKSSVVRTELVPGLQAAGLRVTEPYYQQFHPFENRFTAYWQLPVLPVEYRRESFQVSGDLAAARRSSIATRGAKDVIGVMGVNVAASSNGSVIFVQHGRNIGDIFTEARELVLVIGLDKIVTDQEAATFQAQCMALYGSESLLLDLRYKEASGKSYESLPLAIAPELAGRKIHIIVLDNGRTQLLKSRYRQLLLCVDCRACARVCPVGEIESREGKARRAPREYIYSHVLNRNPASRMCLQCRRCEAVCPVGIELPDLIAAAYAEGGMALPGTLGDYMLRHPETLLRGASRFATLYNRLTTVGPLRWAGEKIAGLSKVRELPEVYHRTFAERFRARSGGSSHRSEDPSDPPIPPRMGDTRGWTAPMPFSEDSSRGTTGDKVVAYFAGCTTNYSEPEIGEAVVEILEKLGMRPVYPEQRCCSIPQLAAGKATAFRQDAVFNSRSLAASGADVVTACSSCLAAIKDDYPKLLRNPDATALSERTCDVMEYLVRHREGGGMPAFEAVDLSLAYHAPCHLIVMGDELIERRLALLRSIPGLRVTHVDRGCCGMGGTFGLKCRNYRASMEIGQALFSAIKEIKPDVVISECPTCRAQIAHGTGLPVDDPVMIVRRALRHVRSASKSPDFTGSARDRQLQS